jgi:thymidylate synthase ThyX
MGYDCKILLDSVNEIGKRLTTFEITFPRCVLSEFNTHRMFSRNSASSRAIPIKRMLERVQSDPFIPERWGKPGKGMGAKEYWPVDSVEHNNLTSMWKMQLAWVITTVANYKSIGNKEDLNRLLEPFMFHTVIVTATEWDNFFYQRTNDSADWKIHKIANLMYEAYHHGKYPLRTLKVGEWHCPLTSQTDDAVLVEQYLQETANLEQRIELCKNSYRDRYEYDHDAAYDEIFKRVSVARCARSSYLTHHGIRDIKEDLDLFDRLVIFGHWSPLEHVATPFIVENSTGYIRTNGRSGNFLGWRQYRKDFPQENCKEFRK